MSAGLSHLPAIISGRRFHSLLAADHWPDAQVYSVFRRVVNIRFGDRLLSVTGPGIGNAACFLVIDLPENSDFSELGVRTGMPVRREEDGIRIGEALSVDCRRLSLWSGRPPSDLVWTEEGLSSQNLVALRETISRWGVKASLAGTARVDQSLRERLERLAVGLRDMGDGLLEAAVSGLIGYGPGSTPAGDDVMIGLLATANGGMRYRGWLRRLHLAVTASLSRTTALSAFLLRQAIAGDYHEYLQEVVYAVISGIPSNVIAAARNLLRMGGASGTYMAVGVCSGFDWRHQVNEAGVP